MIKIDFIGIGVGKSGTTTVARLLEAHPQICLSIPKEVCYFNAFNSYRFKKRDNHHRLKSFNWYFNHFTHCEIDNVKGEFSPTYFIDPEAPKNIYDAFPEAKLIVCFRNPVDRAYSHYQMVKNYHLDEERPFSKVIREEPEYIEKGLYYKHLSRYLAYFKIENILILIFEEIKSDPVATVQKLYSFLNVADDFVPKNIHIKANSAKKTHLRAVMKFEFWFINTISGWGGGRLVKWLKNINWIHKLYTKPYTYPPMKKEDRIWLKEQFIADIEQLEELIQKDFSHWK